MAITAQQLKSRVLMRVGEQFDNTGPVSQNIDTIWDMFADKALIAPDLQFWYCLAEALDIKLGAIADGAYMPVGVVQSKALDDKAAFWTKQRDAALSMAQQIERRYAQVRTPASGTLTTTAPIGPDDDPRTIGEIDANDRPYRGDAYLPYMTTNGRIV